MDEAFSIWYAFSDWHAINSKYHASQGYYDRSHGDNIRLGKRWKKLERILDGCGLNRNQQLTALAILAMVEKTPYERIQLLMNKFPVTKG